MDAAWTTFWASHVLVDLTFKVIHDELTCTANIPTASIIRSLIQDLSDIQFLFTQGSLAASRSCLHTLPASQTQLQQSAAKDVQWLTGETNVNHTTTQWHLTLTVDWQLLINIRSTREHTRARCPLCVQTAGKAIVESSTSRDTWEPTPERNLLCVQTVVKDSVG